ncbi:hypothetical protein [Pseudonocardia sp. ICBG1293]|uniref:hypothetical protein n=1 Tax=Pseudonocardia sp. ICBG1293 TaxID=2844382 RepID=UPI001CCA285A|nr:hypothetical protein [Pseudonocardia sp. ICBG1293]
MTTTASSPHSWVSSRAADRRETRALEARLAREDADAAVRRRIDEQNARQERARADRESAERRRAEQRQARAAARNRALTWASTHIVELLIYPIAVLSFALAAPAMAAYGTHLYGPLGVLLSGITEFGMWAFALAVLAARRQTPERPVLGLQAGVVLFSLVAAGMNLLHGLEQSLTAGVVMAGVSISGVAAHQLTLAGTSRSHTYHPKTDRASAEESAGESRPPRSSSNRGVDPDHDHENALTGRTLDDLRGLLHAAIDDGRVDPGSAESIRRALRCSAARARHLRDTYRDAQRDGGGLR